MAVEIKNTRKGNNLRNRRAKGHLERGRALERKQGAMERAEQYSKLTLDEKIKEQEPFKGKQYRKLMALKEKQK